MQRKIDYGTWYYPKDCDTLPPPGGGGGSIGGGGGTGGGSGRQTIAAGETHTCAVLAGGGVDCWGSNDEGRLGSGTTTDSWTPVQVSGITNAVAVTAGAYHTCALLQSGQVDCWGYNSAGQLRFQ